MKKYLTILWLVMALPAASVDAHGAKLTGTVLDSNRKPVPGATVAMYSGDSLLTGAIADEAGQWSLEPPDGHPEVELRISAVGFETLTQPIGSGLSTALETILPGNAVEVASLSVVPLTDPDFTKLRLGSSELRQMSRRSLVPSNPTAAVIEPAVVREGSQHSSKIRVHGSAPDYYVNDINIGADPNHYGAFTVIPSAVVENLKLHSQGTQVDYAGPAALELTTSEPFDSPLGGEVSLSPLEATGAVSLGNDRLFVLASLRKSVLDKLVNRFDIHSDRRTLPPTNFQDVFASTGIRIGGRHTLILDQYHVQDFLSYSTLESPSNAGGVGIFQHTRDNHFGLRYRWRLPSVEVRARLSARQAKEIYRASPASENAGGFYLDMSEHRRSFACLVEADLDVLDDRVLSIGGRLHRVIDRELQMSQKNWNFLPPDASSDLPHPYQPEINEQYDNIVLDASETNSALWSSFEAAVGQVDLEAGLRLDLFSALAVSEAWSPRLKAGMALGEDRAIELSVGGYAENPVGRLLQPYQVLIRHHSDRLKPVRSWMASAAYVWRGVRFSAFAKDISADPVISPDYSRVSRDGTAEPGFIGMESSGRSTFYGSAITFELNHPAQWPVTLYGFYGYSHAVRRTTGVTLPHELDAPHRFFLQLGYEASRTVHLGAGLAVRSGYPYSGSVSALSADRYTEDWWRTQLSSQNERRFPTHFSLNLHGELNLGRFLVNLNVANATDHGNAMINTSDGFIYDAGILPSLGLTYRF